MKVGDLRNTDKYGVYVDGLKEQRKEEREMSIGQV